MYALGRAGWVLLIVGLLWLFIVILRDLIRQDHVRRDAWQVIYGRKAATLADLDRYLREVRAAPGRPGDDDLLRALAARREQLDS